MDRVSGKTAIAQCRPSCPARREVCEAAIERLRLVVVLGKPANRTRYVPGLAAGVLDMDMYVVHGTAST
jgi:hypothetical protein